MSPKAVVWLVVSLYFGDCVTLSSGTRFSDVNKFDRDGGDISFTTSTPVISHFPFYRHSPATNPEDLQGDIPIILWWSGRLFLGDNLTILRCPNSLCYSTGDRQYLRDPRLKSVYFYGTDLDPEDLPLPRGKDHTWALYHEESPMNNYMLIHYTMLMLFNFTATFRRESDYPLTSQSIISADYLLRRQPVELKIKNKKRQQGLAPVVYVQSHCDVASDRDAYVQELMKYIEIDSLGSCIHNKDLSDDLSDPVKSMDADAFHDVLANYKFHLAFENALCEDYITEKLFRPLHVGSVPIHRGSPSAKDWMPDNHSFIHVDDFESPKALATFIKYLDSHDDEYKKYLVYKKNGIQNQDLSLHLQTREWGNNDWNKPDSLTGFECYICDKITEKKMLETKYPDKDYPVKMAKPKHLHCPQPYTSIGDMSDLVGDDKLRMQIWIDDYWNGLDKAQAIQEMLRRNESDPTTFMKYWEDIIRRQGRVVGLG